MEKDHSQEAELIRYIQQSLETIQYGSIHIIIHDGKITQVERTEKRRLDSK